ncbi:hypothetical protein AFGD_003729 [Aspergillus flavus]|nr:hypothetical protein AFGD_003729 [Aspergillus flavus]
MGQAEIFTPAVRQESDLDRKSNVTGGFLHGAVLISLLQYLPLLYQAVQLETAILSAISLLPIVIISVVIAAASMLMVPLFGGYVWVLRVGLDHTHPGNRLAGPDAANAVAFIDKLSSLDVPHGTLGPVLRVYLKCFQTIFYTMTDLSGLGLVISISVNELDLKSQELGNQRFEEYGTNANHRGLASARSLSTPIREKGLPEAEWQELLAAKKVQDMQRAEGLATRDRLTHQLQAAAAANDTISPSSPSSGRGGAASEAVRNELSAVERRMQDDERVQYTLATMNR